MILQGNQLFIHRSVHYPNVIILLSDIKDDRPFNKGVVPGTFTHLKMVIGTS